MSPVWPMAAVPAGSGVGPDVGVISESTRAKHHAVPQRWLGFIYGGHGRTAPRGVRLNDAKGGTDGVTTITAKRSIWMMTVVLLRPRMTGRTYVSTEGSPKELTA